MLVSGEMDWYCRLYRNGDFSFDKKSWDLIDKLFETINKIKPCGEDNLHTIWFRLKNEYVEDEEYKAWEDEYEEEYVWYRLSTISYETEKRTVKAIFINSSLVMQYISDIDERKYEHDISELIACLIEKVNEAIEMMKEGIYNDYVANNLSYSRRYGTISRQELYNICKGAREYYQEDITQSQIREFEKLISEQINRKEIENKLNTMTAKDFFDACYLGYVENKYKDVEKYLPKEAYYRYADGRDEGLKEIDVNSREEFSKWYFDRERCGGHPWEVCRGGNSTHIDLYPMNEEGKWYYVLRGKSFGRSIETIKFYLALKRNGLPVFLEDAKEILDRLIAKDKIGFVPDFVIPRYCESDFPNENIVDFMHLPYDEDRENLIKSIKWQEIEKQYLNEM